MRARALDDWIKLRMSVYVCHIFFLSSSIRLCIIFIVICTLPYYPTLSFSIAYFSTITLPNMHGRVRTTVKRTNSTIVFLCFILENKVLIFFQSFFSARDVFMKTKWHRFLLRELVDQFSSERNCQTPKLFSTRFYSLWTFQHGRQSSL